MKNNKVLQKLMERHQIYLGLTEEQIKKDPNWIINNPLKGNELNEWIEFGVNTIMSDLGMDRTKAEIEMSWIEGTYGTLLVR